MAAKKLIRYSEHEYNLRLYCLPKTKLLSGNIEHEKLCGDLYVAFRPDWWKIPLEADHYGLKPDRIMIHWGKLIYWEVDRNTENYNRIVREKITKYLQLSAENKERRFNVIFTTVDTERQTGESRAKGLLEMFTTFKRGDQFLVTKHEWACRYPNDRSFVSPVSLDGCAIAELI